MHTYIHTYMHTYINTLMNIPKYIHILHYTHISHMYIDIKIRS